MISSIPFSYTNIMEQAQILEKIREDFPLLRKIRIYHDNNRTLTWRMTRGFIYSYDCGENYASVNTISSKEQMFDGVRKALTDHTTEVILKYHNTENITTYQSQTI